MGIKVENVAKRFGDFQALHPIDIEIQSGSLVALLGPTGS
jgi:sulfate transport system ATP-binding protein